MTNDPTAITQLQPRATRTAKHRKNVIPLFRVAKLTVRLPQTLYY